MPPITGRGINQADLISLLRLIRTNFIAVTAKLDADAGVTDTTYGSIWNFAFPVSIGTVGILHQGAVLDYLKTVRTAWNGVLAKLDLDGGVADTDYNSTKSMASLIDNLTLGSLLQAGVYEGSLVKWLSTFVTNFNSALTKLDADASVTDTNFNSLWAISATLVDATGCVNKPG